MAKSYFHKVVILSAAALIAVLFQNCADSDGRQKALSSQQLDPQNVVSSSYQKIQMERVDSVIINQLPYENNFYEIDTQSGVIQNLAEASTEKFCLSESEKDELNAILANAAVCVPKPVENAADKVCAQVMVEPYAELSGSAGSFRLGEAPDSCTKTLDLCDGQGELLKGFIAHIKSDLNNRACE